MKAAFTLLAAVAAAMAAPLAAAQAYPSRTVRIIVPYAAGGSADEFTRFIRDEIAKYAKVIKVADIKPL